ncbi:RnfH family protein [Billgrantia saliphila]|uniref:RnfH family protein n=1 Tax=Billgrantia saliphila TaxID=1848458 RepID=UPI000CE3B684|nr:RnfH family protein [Halomonas saliphila]
MAADGTIRVEVAFALPDRQRIVTLEVREGATASEAVALAGMERHFPELPASIFSEAELGVFGRRLREPARHRLRDGDRVEIYRSLQIDPKAARLQRAGRNPR